MIFGRMQMSLINRLMSQSPPCVVAVAWQVFSPPKHIPRVISNAFKNKKEKYNKMTKTSNNEWKTFYLLLDLAYWTPAPAPPPSQPLPSPPLALDLPHPIVLIDDKSNGPLFGTLWHYFGIA